MTEKTYFWTDGIGGDATYSPYNATEFNLFHFLPVLGGDEDGAFVIPDYLDCLDVRATTASSHSVTVKAGAALFKDHLYLLDENTTLPIDRAGSGTSRRDLVVLRLSTADNTIRAVIHKGGEAATYPVEPAVTQTGAIWEVPLASVFVSGDAVVLPDNYIEDRRKFIYTVHAHQQYAWATNLLVNSEWLGISYDTGTEAPDGWDIISSGVGSAAIDDGRVSGTSGSGRGDWYIDNLYANLATYGGYAQWVAAGAAHTFTVRGLANVYTDGNYGLIIGLRGFTDSGDESVVHKEIKLMGYNAEDRSYQFTVTFPENNIKQILFYIISESESGVGYSSADIYQHTLVAGYFPGYFRPVSEIVMFKNAVPDALWASTAKSSGTTTIDLNNDFPAAPGQIKNHVKAVILKLRGRDSGSAAGTPGINVQGYLAPFNAVYGSLRLGGVTNDEWRETQVVVPVDQIYFGTGTEGARFRVNVVASGAGTFDATIQIIGIIV